MKTILITGASGFVGPHLVRLYLRQGHTVFGTYRDFKPAANFDSSRFRWIKLDMTRFPQVAECVRKTAPDAVIHLAAQSNARRSWKIPSHTLSVNTQGTIYLLEAIRHHSPRARLLLASSNLTYGKTFRTARPLKEESLCLPENPYAASKRLAELACLDYFAKFGLDTLIARPFNHIGPGQSADFVFADWCRQIALAETGRHSRILEVGNLNARRDFLHVQDVTDAYELLIRKGKSGQIYNICTGKSTLLKNHIDYLLGLAKVPMRFQIKKERLRTDDPRVIAGDPTKIKKLGWVPRHSVFQALREMMGEWRAKV